MADLSLIDWAAPGPYRVAFSTRIGGVSEGDFASLNLGILTEDDPARVVQNRTRLCDAVGADPDGATMAWQRHGATVTRAQPRGIVTPGTVYAHCDGLWTDEPGRAMLLLTADCMPIAIARHEGRASRRRDPARRLARPARRHRRGGRSRARRDEARRGDRPEHRPVLLRGRRRGRDAVPRGVRRRRRARRASSTSGRRPSVPSARPASSRSSGSTSARRASRDRFFSHRRDHGKTGRQGVIAYVA